MTDPLDQIRCGECGRWVMRYEAGALHTVCPRCGADVSIEVTWLLARLRAEIDLLESLVDGDTVDLSLDERKEGSVRTEGRSQTAAGRSQTAAGRSRPRSRQRPRGFG